MPDIQDAAHDSHQQSVTTAEESLAVRGGEDSVSIPWVWRVRRMWRRVDGGNRYIAAHASCVMDILAGADASGAADMVDVTGTVGVTGCGG